MAAHQKQQSPIGSAKELAGHAGGGWVKIASDSDGYEHILVSWVGENYSTMESASFNRWGLYRQKMTVKSLSNAPVEIELTSEPEIIVIDDAGRVSWGVCPCTWKEVKGLIRSLDRAPPEGPKGRINAIGILHKFIRAHRPKARPQGPYSAMKASNKEAW